MSDTNERSVASAGSQPVAWAAVGKNGVPMWLAYHRQDAEGAVVGMAQVVPLYRAPTLTDEERTAIGLACSVFEDYKMSRLHSAADEVLERLLERTK